MTAAAGPESGAVRLLHSITVVGLRIAINMLRTLISIQTYVLDGLVWARGSRSAVDCGYQLFYASDYQQLIDSGVLVLTADEREVFTPAVLRGLEKFDKDTHPTLEQLRAYHKELQVMAMEFVTGRSPLNHQPETSSERAGQPPCSGPPPGATAGARAAADAPEAGASHPAASPRPAGPASPAAAGDDGGGGDDGGDGSYNSDEDDKVDEENPFNFPLSPECLRNMGLSDETEWLGRARAETLIRLLRYKGSPQKQQAAEKASARLTTGMLTQALFHILLPSIGTCPADYVALTKAAYPFGRKWYNRNFISLRNNHVQGNGGGTKGCVTHRHVSAVAKSERARVALRQYLGQPLPPAPPGLTMDEWGAVYLASRWR